MHSLSTLSIPDAELPGRHVVLLKRLAGAAGAAARSIAADPHQVVEIPAEQLDQRSVAAAMRDLIVEVEIAEFLEPLLSRTHRRVTSLILVMVGAGVGADGPAGSAISCPAKLRHGSIVFCTSARIP